MRRFLTSIDKRGNKIPSQNRTGYLPSPPPRPQSGEEIPVASSIPQSIFLHKTRQYFIDIWRSCVSPLRFSQGRRLRASFGSGSSDAEILRCAQGLAQHYGDCTHRKAQHNVSPFAALRVWFNGRRDPKLALRACP